MENDLQEMLTLLNQQSLRISEQQEMIQQLMNDLQQKDKMLSEALQTAEQLKLKIDDSQLIKQEVDRLRLQVKESEYKVERIKAAYQKEISIRKNGSVIDKDYLKQAYNEIMVLKKLFRLYMFFQICMCAFVVAFALFLFL